MSINSGAVAVLSFTGSGSWTTVISKTVTVKLNAGNNTIKFSNSSGWAPDFDRISVSGPLVNFLQNPGFESGNTIWTFSSGTGIGTNLAYLNSGTTKKIAQTLTIGTTGVYTLKGWVSANNTGGVFGIKVNGALRTSVNIPNNQTYNQQIMPGIALNAGDSVEVYITGAASGWINVDDFELL
jgi:hypothetical protein